MTFRNTKDMWGWGAQLLHWSVFALVAFQIISIELLIQDDAPLAQNLFYYGLHKAFGVVVLALVLARAFWRFTNVTPGKDDMFLNVWQKRAAAAVQGLLYLVLLMMSVSGVLMSQAKGYPVDVFGLFTLPAFIGENKLIGGISHETHEIAATALYVLVGLHVAAALMHHFVMKDRVLLRMLPCGLVKSK